MTWHNPCEKKPVQGKKVLCMHKGDIYVAERYNNYWFPTIFLDSMHSRYFEPELWQEINFPEGLTGFKRFKVEDGELITADELEVQHHDVFHDLVQAMKKTVDQYKDKEFEKRLLKQ